MKIRSKLGFRVREPGFISKILFSRGYIENGFDGDAVSGLYVNENRMESAKE